MKIIDELTSIKLTYIKISFLALCISIGSLITVKSQSSTNALKVGFITDFKENNPSYFFVNDLKEEISSTVGNTANIEFLDSNILSSNWNKENAQNLYRSLSKKVDVIVVVGALSLEGIAELKEFEKPIVGVGVFSPQLQKIPFKNGISGVKNLTYALTTQSLKQELTIFHELLKFDKLAILVDERTSSIYSDNTYLDSLSTQLNAGYEIVESGENTDVISEKISADTDAVYIALTYERGPEEIAKIAKKLTDRKIATFSPLSDQVKNGVLAAFSDDNVQEQLKRKVALLVEDVAMKKDISKSKVGLEFREKLFLNIATAEKIDFSPTFETLFDAEIIGQDSLYNGTKFSIYEVISLSLENNLNILISKEDLNLAKKEVALAKAQYLPQIEASANVVQIDKDRAESSFGGQAERTLTGSGTLSQLIYSEQAIANIQIQKYLKVAEEAAFDQQALNVILDTFKGYFSVLRAKSSLQVQQENLESTKKNLEFAKVRVRIGASNKSDVYRWESEVANATQAVVRAQSQYAQSKLQLGQILNMELAEEFELAEISLEDESFKEYTDNNLGQFIKTADELRNFTDFLVEEALERNPAVQQIKANQNVVNRRYALNQRSFFLPRLAVQAQLDQKLWDDGAGSESTGSIPGLPAGSAPTQDDLTWSLALNVSIPIFTGGQRKLDLQKSAIQRKQLSYQKRDVYQSLELGIRAQMYDLFSASTNVNYSKVSSENAQKNFEIVQNSYQKGAIPINQLLDAQQSAFSARLNYSNSVYDYLISFIAIENTVGRYTLLSPEEENKAFIQRYINFIQQK